MAGPPIDFPPDPATDTLWPQPPIPGVPVWRWDGEKWVSGLLGNKQPILDDGTIAMKAQLTVLPTPVALNDATSKKYVDEIPSVRYGSAQSLSVAQQTQARNNINAAEGSTAIMRGYIDGLIMTPTAGTNTISVSKGIAADATNSTLMALTAPITKNTQAWQLGNNVGCLDTGAITISTWYHVYLIRNASTGAVDICMSTTATPASGPKMPPGFTQYRRIGSVFTDVSLNWTMFTQLGDEFIWSATVRNVNNLTVPTTRVMVALTVPDDISVMAMLRVFWNSTPASCNLLLTSPFETDQAVGTGGAGITFRSSAAGDPDVGPVTIRTNTARQICARSSASSSGLYISTYGWVDRRGKDA